MGRVGWGELANVGRVGINVGQVVWGELALIWGEMVGASWFWGESTGTPIPMKIDLIFQQPRVLELKLP